ncbi:hypothetical protein Anapl_16883 [Anas platyrhynchos]|uniref:Uncharacterized protein n=1 Tax=Anas platyrhynchos TaxID=8839 RepID=R0KZS2_ANAPL|nr:hypothetical protein Anapl_16883 [Anas platyrhynchos]
MGDESWKLLKVVQENSGERISRGRPDVQGDGESPVTASPPPASGAPHGHLPVKPHFSSLSRRCLSKGLSAGVSKHDVHIPDPLRSHRDSREDLLLGFGGCSGGRRGKRRRSVSTAGTAMVPGPPSFVFLPLRGYCCSVRAPALLPSRRLDDFDIKKASSFTRRKDTWFKTEKQEGLFHGETGVFMPVISPSAPNQQVQLFSTGLGMVIEGELRKCFSHIQMLFSHEVIRCILIRLTTTKNWHPSSSLAIPHERI